MTEDELLYRKVLRLEEDLSNLRVAVLGPQSPTNVILIALEQDRIEWRAQFRHVDERLDRIEGLIQALAAIVGAGVQP